MKNQAKTQEKRIETKHGIVSQFTNEKTMMINKELKKTKKVQHDLLIASHCLGSKSKRNCPIVPTSKRISKDGIKYHLGSKLNASLVCYAQLLSCSLILCFGIANVTQNLNSHVIFHIAWRWFCSSLNA